jgi:hypothetical protein
MPLLLFALGLSIGAAAWLRPGATPPARARATPAPEAALPSQASDTPPPAEPAPLIAVKPVAPLEAKKVGPLSEADAKAYEALVDRLNSGEPIGAEDVQTAISLQSRYPAEKAIQRLLTETLMQAAGAEVQKDRTPQAIAYLRNAAALPWADGRPRTALLNIYLAASDWPAVEGLAQEMIAANARDADAWYALGQAQFRQDRAREAIQALKACLEITEHVPARLLLARIQKNLADEQGMTEQHLSHFHVRYDGDEHADVGREILLQLERHYATLVTALDFQPRNTIPVILFSRDQYFAASGAPSWSGGVFDHEDGRIRIPIGGLTRSLSPYMDNTLMHELTHAFIDEKSGGVAPRPIHEGLAQYMAGDRVADRLTTKDGLAALADGRIGGVWQFYLEALSLVEYLMAQRGAGGMNDVLKAMGETHSVDEAFRQVYGNSFLDTQKAWHQRLRQEYGR